MPSGTRLTGTGTEIVGGNGHVVLDDLEPLGTLPPTRTRVTAYEEDHGYSGQWAIRAHALCI